MRLCEWRVDTPAGVVCAVGSRTVRQPVTKITRQKNDAAKELCSALKSCVVVVLLDACDVIVVELLAATGAGVLGCGALAARRRCRRENNVYVPLPFVYNPLFSVFSCLGAF